MKKYFFLSMIVLLQTAAISQITITLQPDSIEGKDVMVWTQPNVGGHDTINRGSDDRLLVHAWTNSLVPDTSRSLIEFDLNSIPAGAYVIDARLNLYNNPTTPSFNGQHSGQNQSVVRRVVQEWDESTVLWNTKPAYISLNEVWLAESTSPYEDFLDINVSQLVQDMIDNPNSSFGFVIQLQTEIFYRALVFASSDHADSTKHPKLVVTYDTTTIGVNNINYIKEKAIAFPNPFRDRTTISYNNSINEKIIITIYDIHGRLVRTIADITTNKVEVERKNLTNGLYFFHVCCQNKIQATGKLIVE